jgi:tRNA(Arg) A34 adenosine deaminase TadA
MLIHSVVTRGKRVHRKHVRRCGRDGTKDKLFNAPELQPLLFANGLMDIVERDLLPLTCTGVLDGQLPCGAVVVTPACSLVAAASSEEIICPLYAAELLALEEAGMLLNSPEKLATCAVLVSHKEDILSALGQAVMKKCGITRVYTLLDDDTSGVFVDDIEVISVLSLIGTVAPGQRNFTSEEACRVQFTKENRIVKTQLRLQVIKGIYEKLVDKAV